LQCPQCEEKDYSYYDKECVNGQKERVYYWTTPFCYGGAKLPPSALVECSNISSIFLRNFLLIFDSGSEVTLRTTTIIIAIVAGSVAFIAALGVIIFLYWKHKKLYKDYSQLKNSNIPLDESDSDVSLIEEISQN
jgi:cbb3-type cytochrome oxidase subunit 3